ncbi:protein CONSERVED IN THE GREEN LINEAGE AND DIATOMS 27, chloroplastic isoform X4 [Phoenix dactylifera]|uniref:Protein CONSERVED IN THE GREEN LINEAGE AND DIATOMS 27, chloroplastic isoform X4 n=1 Tax=Phoenix dactylifera TaxID=42345 RepID=A0A8B9AHD7_PHODC|nr:protein CONSERVED IN THE GREEN LINEAGE AND DIATOMS 27, chloroplastic isoform X4 [Phoenix dactylifera]
MHGHKQNIATFFSRWIWSSFSWLGRNETESIMSYVLKTMLRLQISGHAIRDNRLPCSGGYRNEQVLRVWRVNCSSRWNHVSIVKALKDEAEGGAGGFAGQRWDPGLEIEVPFEQRPVNEYSLLKNSILYSWGDLSPRSLFLRLGSLWLVTFTVLGAPIAAASFNPSKDPLKFVLAAGTGTLLLVSLVVLRIYLVKPVIKLLKQTLVGTGVLLVTAVSLFIFAAPVEDFLHSAFDAKGNNLNLPTSSKNKFNLRKEELLSLPVEVKDDDDLAAAAAKAADGRPVYCRDRFYRALAGGQYCKWDDLLN